MANKRIYVLDYIRVVSMLAVVMIHVSSTYIFSDSKLSLYGMNMAFFFNQAARFAVPAFVLLSGVSLGFGKQYDTYGGFVLSRLNKIMPHYLFWCAVYCFYNYGLSLSAILQRGTAFLPEVLYAVATGDFASHLYFIPVIIQMYLLYPLLKKLKVRFGPGLFIGAFIISFFFHCCVYLTAFEQYVLPRYIRRFTWILSPTWLIYFTAGLYISEPVIEKCACFAEKNKGLLLVFTLLFVFFFSWESLLTNSFELSLKPQVFVYVPLVLLLVAGVARDLQKYRGLNTVIAALSQCSMTVYFSHILLLYFLRRFMIFSNGMAGMTLLYIATAGGSIFFALAVDQCKRLGVKLFTKKEASM